jgi:hypothetical protein
MGRRWVAATALAAALAACGGSDDDPATAPSDAATPTAPTGAAVSTASEATEPTTTTTAAVLTSFAGVVALTETSLRGGVYHATITLHREDGPDDFDATTDLWIDIVRDAVRRDTTLTTADGHVVETTELTADGISWYQGIPGSVRPCWDATAATTALLECFRRPEPLIPVVEVATLDGHPAIVLVTTGERDGSDSSETFTTRLYLDPATGLPLASETTGTRRSDTSWEISATARYEHELLGPASVPADLFDAGALGWHVASEDDLPAGQAIGWFGTEVDAGAGLPALVLASVEPGLTPPGYVAILHYAATTDRFNSLLAIQPYPRAAWDDPRAVQNPTPCADHPPIEVPGGTATLQCQPGLDVVTGAIVDLGDIVLRVYPTGPLGVPNPFADADALTALLAHLEIRPA